MTDDTPKPLKDMTDAEIGALVRARHEGQIIECLHNERWFHISSGDWFFDLAYRIRPAPVRETVTFIGGIEHGFDYSGWGDDRDTHRITVNLIDGKPDCASIRMEEL